MNLRFVTFVFVLLSTMSIASQDLRLITYNIRYATEKDGQDQWDLRKDNVCSLISEANPDIFGIQEGLSKQTNFIKHKLAEYTYVGVGRDDGMSKGEYCAIYYKSSRIELLHSETFWLSETPDVPSLGWDAAYPRICTAAMFRLKSEDIKFWVFNTHFDHVGEVARQKSAELILSKIRQMNVTAHPVVLMGDFNLLENSNPIQYILSELNDTYSADEVKSEGPGATFNGFDLSSVPDQRIDYIFISRKGLKVLKTTIIDAKIKQRYPSDHFPVYTELEFK